MLFWAFFFFLPFYPTNNPENYNLEKIYKIPGDIILLQMCTIRSYDLWFLRYKTWWTEFFVNLQLFLPFDPPNNLKRSGDNIILHLFTTNDIVWCMFPEIWSAIDNTLSFWATFCPFTQLTTPKIKTWKKMKKARRYYHFTLVYHKWRSHVCYGYRMYGSWDMQHNR